MDGFELKYQLDTDENREFLKKNCEELFSFGHKFPSPGGSAYYLGEDGIPLKEKDRETWITARMVHVYSLAKFLKHPGSEELINEGVKGLIGELCDKKNGGWYAGVTADGKSIPGKQCYIHAFVILAAASASLAEQAGARELLEEALRVYDQRFWNEEDGLSYDTWNTDFSVLDDYRGLNANMHTVEAFLAAADVLQDEKYRERAGRIINRVIAWAESNQWRINEHYTKDWQPMMEYNRERPADQFKPYGAIPGHGLEWARLIVQWVTSAYPNDQEKREQYVGAAEELFNRAVEDGWKADGKPGFVYTTDWAGTPIISDRMFWTLAEGINTAAVLYRATGKAEYAKYYAEFMQYLDDKVLDHEKGAWFSQLDRDNEVIGTVWPGKPDLYHSAQAMLIPYASIDRAIAVDVYQRSKTEDR